MLDVKFSTPHSFATYSLAPSSTKRAAAVSNANVTFSNFQIDDKSTVFRIARPLFSDPVLSSNTKMLSQSAEKLMLCDPSGNNMETGYMQSGSAGFSQNPPTWSMLDEMRSSTACATAAVALGDAIEFPPADEVEFFLNKLVAQLDGAVYDPVSYENLVLEAAVVVTDGLPVVGTSAQNNHNTNSGCDVKVEPEAAMQQQQRSAAAEAEILDYGYSTADVAFNDDIFDSILSDYPIQQQQQTALKQEPFDSTTGTVVMSGRVPPRQPASSATAATRVGEMIYDMMGPHDQDEAFFPQHHNDASYYFSADGSGDVMLANYSQNSVSNGGINSHNNTYLNNKNYLYQTEQLKKEIAASNSLSMQLAEGPSLSQQQYYEQQYYQQQQFPYNILYETAPNSVNANDVLGYGGSRCVGSYPPVVSALPIQAAARASPAAIAVDNEDEIDDSMCNDDIGRVFLAVDADEVSTVATTPISKCGEEDVVDARVNNSKRKFLPVRDASLMLGGGGSSVAAVKKRVKAENGSAIRASAATAREVDIASVGSPVGKCSISPTGSLTHNRRRVFARKAVEAVQSPASDVAHVGRPRVSDTPAANYAREHRKKKKDENVRLLQQRDILRRVVVEEEDEIASLEAERIQLRAKLLAAYRGAPADMQAKLSIYLNGVDD